MFSAIPIDYTNRLYQDNLKHFLLHGLRPDDGCDFVLILQGTFELEDSDKKILKARIKHQKVWILKHENECYYLGSVGWLLAQQQVNIQSYNFFIFLNSSARGPFYPSYFQNHWTDIFISRLSAKVRLVGASINCGAIAGSKPIPHVQTYAFATDSAGFKLLQSRGVFDCYQEFSDVITRGEMEASRAMFEAGYQVASLMIRHQGVD